MKIFVFIGGFFVGLIGIILMIFLFITATAPDRYTILVIGSDQRGTERSRSDVMFLVSIHKNPEIAPYFFTIPRDTKIDHEKYGLQKMTHFYAIGDRPDDGKFLGNYELTSSIIEELLDIEIDATVEVTFESFEDIIDSLGGAILNGKTVTGPEALAVVRDRFTDGRSDFDRQADGREIFRSLLTKIKEPARIRSLQEYFIDSKKARLTYNKAKLIHFLVGTGIARRGDVSIGEIEEGAIPGTGARIYTPDFGKELYYWIPDEEALATLVDEKLR